jgi:hypothetical protein
MKVIYDGPYEAVELPLSPSRTEVVEKGESIDVPDDIAKNLIEQGTWVEPKASHRSKKEED